MENKLVSIIIPTYRDWARISLCIEALTKQTYPKNMFEVIIVNNDQTDDAPLDFLLPERYSIIIEEKPGSYAARNAGLKLAKGEIIGFTDSDCIPDKDWIKNAVDYFEQNATCSRIAGRILVFPKLQRATLAEKYDQLYAFRQKEYVELYGTCVTGNMFAYKYVFEKVGPFNEEQMSFGDFDWGVKASQALFKIDFVENVIIYHPARDMAELIKKEKRLAGGRVKTWKEKRDSFFIYRKFLDEVRPRVRGEYQYIREKGTNLDEFEKFSIMLLRIRFNYIRAYEAMKIRFGKQPNRE